MRQVREILRMKHEAGLAVREIARRSGVPRRTVRALLERCAARGLGWPIGPEVSEADLEGLMFREAGAKAGGAATPRAGLGCDPQGAQAQACHAADPVGRVH